MISDQSTEAPRPSVCVKEGALRLGIVTPRDSVALALRRLTVDRFFISAALEGRTTELRSRFARTCAESGCRRSAANWCEVIDTMLGTVQATNAALAECSLCPYCRWHLRNGMDAYHICALVITDCRPQAHDGAVR